MNLKNDVLPSEVKTTRFSGNTSEFAKQYFVKPDTVRSRYCLTGSYFGIVPITKLPNGRLVWPLLEARNVKGEDA